MTDVGDVHAFEFGVRGAVLGDCGVVYAKEAQSFGIKDPSGKRIVREQQTKHRFGLRESVFGAAAFDGESDVAADGIEKFEIALVVSAFIRIMLNDEDADGGGRRFQRNAEPGRRGSTDE